MMNFLVRGLSFFASVLFLAACGQPVCVAGIGSCSSIGTASTPSGGTSLVLNVSTPTTKPNIPVTLTVTGGVAPFTFAITGPQGCGVLGNTGSTSSATTTFTGVALGACNVQVTDSTTPTALVGTTSITISN